MKTDSPYDRGDIHINKNDKVLEMTLRRLSNPVPRMM